MVTELEIAQAKKVKELYSTKNSSELTLDDLIAYSKVEEGLDDNGALEYALSLNAALLMSKNKDKGVRI